MWFYCVGCVACIIGISRDVINSNLSELKSGLVGHKLFRQSFTIQAGDNIRITQNIALNGYMALGFSTIASNQPVHVFPTEWQIANNIAYITLKNSYTQAISTDIVFRILYLKS